MRASDYGLRSADLEVRLDAFLCRHLHWRSRTSVQRLIRDGFVQVAMARPERALGQPRPESRSGVRLHHGARVVVRIPDAERLGPPRDEVPGLVVLHEDDEVLAVDKPPFLPVHPSGRYLTDTLIQRVHARYLTDGEPAARVPVRLCHRLDRETSGIVLCAKGAAPHRRLMRQFERREVEKEYLAIVVGQPDEDSGTIDLPLGPDRHSQVHLRIAVVPDGLPARTRWRVLERRGGHALVSCRPVTGRQHQIRVHLEAIGHPIVGDKLYGPDEEIFLRGARNELTERDQELLGLPRHALHNHRLVWRSPRSGERIEVTSPLAEDLSAWFELLPA